MSSEAGISDGVASTARARRPRLRIALALLAALLVPVAAGGAYLGISIASGNFASVVDGEVFRSAQPTAAALAAYHQKYGIRTVINLRGSHPGAAWYEQEVDAAGKLGITVISMPLSATREVSKAQMSALVAAMRDAPKPLLIHCRSGADRTGLASALYLAAIKGVEAEAAEKQLSIRFGHFDTPLSPSHAMDRSFDDYEPTLALLEQSGQEPYNF